MNIQTQVFDIHGIKKNILEYAKPSVIIVFEYEYYAKFAKILKRTSKNDIIYLCTNNQLGCKKFIVKIDDNQNKYTELIWDAQDDENSRWDDEQDDEQVHLQDY